MTQNEQSLEKESYLEGIAQVLELADEYFFKDGVREERGRYFNPANEAAVCICVMTAAYAQCQNIEPDSLHDMLVEMWEQEDFNLNIENKFIEAFNMGGVVVLSLEPEETADSHKHLWCGFMAYIMGLWDSGRYNGGEIAGILRDMIYDDTFQIMNLEDMFGRYNRGEISNYPSSSIGVPHNPDKD